MPTTSPAVLLLALLGACISPKPLDSGTTGGGDDTGGGGGGGGGGGDTAPSIAGLYDGSVPLDAVVTIEGVVVTSPLTREGDGFFVADPAGGPNSGLYVWNQSGFDETYDVGDELTITGTPTDYYGWIEFTYPSIEITGEADVPAPVDLGDGAGVDWEQYESVVVKLDQQVVTSVNAYNTGTLSSGIDLDDGFQYLDFDCRGAYETLTGVVFYQYEAHSLNPRDAADLGTYTAPSAAPATVAQIQAGETCGPVILEDVVATTPTVDDDGSSLFFVQDAGGGAMSGIGVYVEDTAVAVSEGDVLTLTGDASEFYDFSQLYVTDPAGVDARGAGGTPVAESLSAAPSDWEPYEGMLVTLAGVSVTSDQEYGEVDTDWNIGIDNLFYDHPAANGDRYATVTGVIYYSYSEWKIEPRGAGDLVAAE